MKLICNKAQCKNCNSIIESKCRHDFITCSCFKDELNNKGIFIDGGLDYQRIGGDLENFIDLSQWEK